MKVLKSIVVALLSLIVVTAPRTADAQRNITATIDIISYNDVYEMLPDSVNGLTLGGPSRVVPLVNEMRAKNPNSLVLFAGDTMSPSLWSSQMKGMQMVAAHNALGLDFACLGNHEFDFGIEAFFNVSAASNFPWLNANCYETATGELLRGTVPRATKTFNDPVFGSITIGFTGVMYNLNDVNKGCYWEDPIASAQVQVNALQEEGVDMIIALTHQDFADDNAFSHQVTGVDLIFAGHDHVSMLQTNFGAPYLKSDYDFRTIWQSTIEYYAADSENDKVFLMTHENIPITEDMSSDKDLDAVIDEFAAQISELTKQVIGTLCEELDVTQQTVRTKDCAVGALFTNAALAFYGNSSADAAVMNGGGIRTNTNYPAGNLTIAQVISWAPFGNTFIITETDGRSFKEYLAKEMLASCGDGFINQNGFYVHAGGIKYTFTCTGTSAGSLTSLEWHNHPTFSGDVQDTDVFKLAMSNYVYSYNFITIDGITSSIIIDESASSRIDTAVETYIASLPNAEVCVKAQNTSLVTF